MTAVTTVFDSLGDRVVWEWMRLARALKQASELLHVVGVKSNAQCTQHAVPRAGEVWTPIHVRFLAIGSDRGRCIATMALNPDEEHVPRGSWHTPHPCIQ